MFLVDGRVEVDNNTVERCIRPIPLGRKNALFAGSHERGGKGASNGPEGVLASLINTAKLHDIDPETYLADVLERIVSGRTKVNASARVAPVELEGGSCGSGRRRRMTTQRPRQRIPLDRAGDEPRAAGRVAAPRSSRRRRSMAPRCWMAI